MHITQQLICNGSMLMQIIVEWPINLNLLVNIAQFNIY